jgi:hypothetical protein
MNVLGKVLIDHAGLSCHLANCPPETIVSGALRHQEQAQDLRRPPETHPQGEAYGLGGDQVYNLLGKTNGIRGLTFDS